MNKDNYELSAEWQDWLTKNALEGASAEQLVSALIEEGLSRESAEEELYRLVKSGPFRAAMKWRKQALRYKKLNALKLALHRWHGLPHIERRRLLSPEQLRVHYLRVCQPVILTDIIDRWPAISKWTNDYLRKRVGHVFMTCCKGRELLEDPNRDIKRFYEDMYLTDFITEIESYTESNDLYLVGNNKFLERDGAAVLLEDLNDDIAPFLQNGIQAKSCSFWYGPKGTHTELHYDPISLLYAQIRGTKRFRFLSPHNAVALMSAQGTYSKIDLEEAAQRMGDLVYEVVLKPGELLLLPTGWWHEVTALETSISLGFSNLIGAINFSWYTPGFEGEECILLDDFRELHRPIK
jgi:hypothetical protein